MGGEEVRKLGSRERVVEREKENILNRIFRKR